MNSIARTGKCIDALPQFDLDYRRPILCGRSGRSRAKRISGGRSEDQNFTHHLAPVVVPPALLVVEITLQARTGFAVSQLQTALPVCAHTYVDVSFDQWRDQELGKRGLSAH